MELYVGEEEIPKDQLHDIVDSSFGRFVVPEVNKVDDVIAFHDLDENVTVAELFHGPTFAFKDLALSVVGNLYSYFLNKRQKHMTILVGKPIEMH